MNLPLLDVVIIHHVSVVASMLSNREFYLRNV